MIQRKIAVLAGDGIGPEVTASAVQVLHKIGHRFDCQFEFTEALLGHSAIEATGEPLPDKTLEVCREAGTVLMGSVGHPMYDNNPQAKVRPEQGLLKLRKELGLFTNIRPIQIFSELISASSLKPEILEGVDIMFFRELTGGIYFGQPRERRDNGNTALDTMIYSRYEVERIAHQAFKSAQNRNKRLCSVDKANVLESSRLWRETVQEMAKQYPDVEVTHQFVDNAAMQLIKYPRQFDVILTENMFGDILTDLASQLSGSLGMLPSASVGSEVGLFEPIHGSAPDIAGLGVANPMASILSAALLLEISFEMKEAAEKIRQAIAQVLAKGYRTHDTADNQTDKNKILGTKAITELILEFI
jgi:3-isopropylmalate dehydrogenase